MKTIMIRHHPGRNRGTPALVSLLIASCILLSVGITALEAAPADRSRFRDTQTFQAHDRYDQLDRRGQRVATTRSRSVGIRLGWLPGSPGARTVEAPKQADRSASVLRVPEARRPAVEVLVERWNPSIPPWHTTAQGYGLIIPDLAHRPGPETDRVYEEDEEGPSLQDNIVEEWYLGAVAPDTITDPDP